MSGSGRHRLALLIVLLLAAACRDAEAGDRVPPAVEEPAEAPAGAPVVHEFTPSFDATDRSPTYELATTTEYPHGKPAFGLYTDDGTTVEVWARVVTGSAYEGDTPFDPGAGSYYLPLPVPPHPDMTGPVGEGQVVVIDDSDVGRISTFVAEIDPGLDVPFGLVDELGEQSGVAYMFLDDVGGDLPVEDLLVGVDNPRRPSTHLIIAYHLRYLRA